MNTPPTEPTILVTGATDGIGKGTARELARRGARVLLHGRSAERVAAARDEIAAATGNDRLETYVADFASLSDVHHLAERVSARHDRLHVLINNAGIGAGPRGRQREVSADGHELRLQVNHLAPLLLAHLLLPLLRARAPARIVNVASAGQAPLDFADLMLEHGYDGMRDRACFAFKACAELFTGNFNCYCTVQPNVQSAEDLPHAARTDRCNDLVPTEFVAYRKRHMGGCG